MSPDGPGSTLALSSARSEAVKGVVAREGGRIVRGVSYGFRNPFLDFLFVYVNLANVVSFGVYKGNLHLYILFRTLTGKERNLILSSGLRSEHSYSHLLQFILPSAHSIVR